MGCEGNAGDLGTLGAGNLGYRQGSRTYAHCADHKTRPIHEDVSTRHPLYQHISQQEENATVEEDIGTGRQAAGSYSSATASLTAGRHW